LLLRGQPRGDGGFFEGAAIAFGAGWRRGFAAGVAAAAAHPEDAVVAMGLSQGLPDGAVS